MSTAAAPLAGLRIASFESRRAEEIARLIERAGGQPRVSPSLREVPLAENPEAIRFAEALVAGEIDVVLLLTGVGTRYLVAHIERHGRRSEFLAALARATIVARGPKPIAALKEMGLAPNYRVPEPNTWRELLATLDEHVPLAGKTVAVQEYGLPNASLVAGLGARGATVRTIKVYDWDLPEDIAPLEANLRALAAGELDVVMFTSAHQVVNVLRVAERMQMAEAVRRGFDEAVVASIGPTTSETLRECELPVDLEPEHPKMGQLVSAVAERGPALVDLKRRRTERVRVSMVNRIDVNSAVPTGGDKLPPWHDSPFMRACRREPAAYTPIWLMRQAGRYLPEYRAIREKTSFLELCKNPDLCAEVMITTVNRLGVDAAIIFSDLLPMLEPMGADLEFAAGEGPVIHNPVRAAEDVDRIHELQSVEALEFVMETVRRTRAGLRADIPVIGFAGAPFTLASYIVEGGSSRSFLHTKTLMYRDESAWGKLMSRLARSVARYLAGQIEAGAQAVQIFDSWIGCLGPDDYRRYVLPYSKMVIDALPAGVPVIHFGTGNPALAPLLTEAGGTVIGIDWRVRLDDAWRTIGYDRAVQGNLDPLVLLADPSEIRRRAADILQQAAGRAGHIFNLGHGVLPQTPVDNVLALIDAVHELSFRSASR